MHRKGKWTCIQLTGMSTIQTVLWLPKCDEYCFYWINCFSRASAQNSKNHKLHRLTLRRKWHANSSLSERLENDQLSLRGSYTSITDVVWLLSPSPPARSMLFCHTTIAALPCFCLGGVNISHFYIWREQFLIYPTEPSPKHEYVNLSPTPMLLTIIVLMPGNEQYLFKGIKTHTRLRVATHYIYFIINDGGSTQAARWRHFWSAVPFSPNSVINLYFCTRRPHLWLSTCIHTHHW